MKVLITTPDLALEGGVANYFRTIRMYLPGDVDYFHVGAASVNETKPIKLKRLIGNSFRFRRILKEKEYSLIHINPSFNFGALIRDGILLRISKRHGRKTIIFFRGFNLDNVQLVDKHFRKIFYSTYNHADAFILLGSAFKDQLRKWGFKQPIYLETTLVDDAFSQSFSLEHRIHRIKTGTSINLLFLSRILREKGIIETLDAFNILCGQYDNLHLTVAGDGPFMQEAFQYAEHLSCKRLISFLGFVVGEQKKNLMMNSDIYVFPSYSEGMPNSVLEAMACGLPTIATPVGGLKDFFVDGKHGFLVQSNTPQAIADAIGRLIENKSLRESVCLECYEAVPRFLASNVAKRLEAIYEEVLNLNPA